MKTLLYLDDTKNPFFELPQRVVDNYKVILVRDFDEFQIYIEERNMPDLVSFDHDLAEEHYTPEYFWDDYEASKKYQEYVKPKYKNETGEYCAKFLKSYCINNNHKKPKYLVHSANPIGADWIRDQLTDFTEIKMEDL